MDDVKVAACVRENAGLAARLLFADPAAGAATLARRGISLDDVFVAVHEGSVVGAVVSQVAAGGCGWLWPPIVARSQIKRGTQIASALVRCAARRLAGSGCTVIQSLLVPGENRTSLEAHQFRPITEILGMECDPRVVSRSPIPRVELVSCTADDVEVLRDVVECTYEATRDCPELDNVRGAREMIEGFRRAAPARERWWLAREADDWIGCVIGAHDARDCIYELQYLGVVPRVRGRGLGRALCRHAVLDAQRFGADRVVVSVDARNAPALDQYRAEGFRETARRVLLLRVLNPLDFSGI